MSPSMRERWQQRLDEAQTSPLWRTRLEVRVLRFLLARYVGRSEDVQQANFPLYEGKPVNGRTRLLLSPHEQKQRLRHIAQENLGQRVEIFPFDSHSLERGAWREIQRRRKREAFRQFGQKPPRPPHPLYYLPRWLEWLYFDIGRWALDILNRVLPRRPRISFPQAGIRLKKATAGLKFVYGILCSRR